MSRLIKAGHKSFFSKPEGSTEHQFICKFLLRKSVADLSFFLEGPLLDIGCGSRPYDNYFFGLKKVNCDPNIRRGLIDIACKAGSLPFANESFKSVLCTEVLEHVPNPNQAIREIARVLSSKGRALISVPCWWPAHELPNDYFRYPEQGLRFLAESNGFAVLQLIPRGGLYAFLGQVAVLLLAQYFPSALQRSLWNKALIKIDRWRKNYSVSLGWSILIEKQS